MTFQLNEDLFGLQPSGPREPFRLESNGEIFGMSGSPGGPDPVQAMAHLQTGCLVGREAAWAG